MPFQKRSAALRNGLPLDRRQNGGSTPTNLASLVMICQNQYFAAAFKQKEAEITSLLNFRVGSPTAGVFLPAFLLGIGEDEKFDLSWFFLDVALHVIGLFEVETPVIAAAADVKGIAGAGREVRIQRLCSLTGHVDRGIVLGTVSELAECSGSIVAQKPEGLWKFYARGDAQRLIDATRRVDKYLARERDDHAGPSPSPDSANSE
jgi:hypothetical protein